MEAVISSHSIKGTEVSMLVFMQTIVTRLGSFASRCVDAYVCAWRSEVNSGCLYVWLFSLVLETRPLTEPRVHQFS